MTQCLEQVERTHGTSVFGAGEKEALLAAALLHDIGHGPFSHATESFFDDHVARAVSIITNCGSSVNKVLSEVDEELPGKVASLVAKKPLKGLPQPHLWQKSLISSQLDMDRLDYLRRDSLASGAEYGNFDWFRILHTMALKKSPPNQPQKPTLLVWPDKTKYAIEEYIFARFYMYQSVYYHHTTRAFEQLLLKILNLGRELASQQDHRDFKQHILPPLRPFLTSGQTLQLNDFLYLTDDVVMAQVAVWNKDRNPVLSDLARRLLFRTGLGWTSIQGTEMENPDKIIAIRNYLDQQGKDHNYYLLKDSAKASVYNPYRSVSAREEQSSVTSIILCDEFYDGGLAEISEVPDLQRLKAITAEKSSPVMRYYFPKEHERQIKKLLS